MCQKTFASNAGATPAGEQQQQQQLMQEEELDPLVVVADDDASTESAALCMHPSRIGRSVSPKQYSSWQTSHLQRIWAVHFGITFLVLLYGAYNNDDRKYISVEPSNVPGNCVKAFVDVLANSHTDDESALICCTANEGGFGICNKTPSYLIFARRLAHFPEAWLLPVFPLVLRGALRFYQFMTGTLPAGDTYFSSVPNYSTTCRRITLYLSCILARGVILYSLFNLLEEFVVTKHDADSADEPCWYKDFLRASQTPCTGREFDFSDHVVLYFAQLIPVALSETVYALRVPFWRKDNTLMPVLLVGGLFYLYAITFLGAYKTSAYFHTPAEIFTGFGVSLLLQIPLCLLQCSPDWRKSRAYFYGQPATGFNTLIISAK